MFMKNFRGNFTERYEGCFVNETSWETEHLDLVSGGTKFMEGTKTNYKTCVPHLPLITFTDQ